MLVTSEWYRRLLPIGTAVLGQPTQRIRARLLPVTLAADSADMSISLSISFTDASGGPVGSITPPERLPKKLRNCSFASATHFDCFGPPRPRWRNIRLRNARTGQTG